MGIIPWTILLLSFRSGFRIVELDFEGPLSRQCQLSSLPTFRPYSPPTGSESHHAKSSSSRTLGRPARNSSPSLPPCQSTFFPVAADHLSLVHPRRLAAQSVAPSTCRKGHHVVHTDAPPARSCPWTFSLAAPAPLTHLQQLGRSLLSVSPWDRVIRSCTSSCPELEYCWIHWTVWRSEHFFCLISKHSCKWLLYNSL